MNKKLSNSNSLPFFLLSLFFANYYFCMSLLYVRKWLVELSWQDLFGYRHLTKYSVKCKVCKMVQYYGSNAQSVPTNDESITRMLFMEALQMNFFNIYRRSY